MHVGLPCIQAQCDTVRLHDLTLFIAHLRKQQGLLRLFGISTQAQLNFLVHCCQVCSCILVQQHFQLAAAQAALGDLDHIENSKGENTAGLVQLAEGLDALGFTQIPSVANFIAFDCGGDAETVYQGLLREGVIVRPLGGYGLPNHLRVTAGTARDNERFLQALKQVTRR